MLHHLGDDLISLPKMHLWSRHGRIYLPLPFPYKTTHPQRVRTPPKLSTHTPSLLAPTRSTVVSVPREVQERASASEDGPHNPPPFPSRLEPLSTSTLALIIPHCRIHAASPQHGVAHMAQGRDQASGRARLGLPPRHALRSDSSRPVRWVRAHHWPCHSHPPRPRPRGGLDQGSAVRLERMSYVLDVDAHLCNVALADVTWDLNSCHAAVDTIPTATPSQNPAHVAAHKKYGVGCDQHGPLHVVAEKRCDCVAWQCCTLVCMRLFWLLASYLMRRPDVTPACADLAFCTQAVRARRSCAPARPDPQRDGAVHHRNAPVPRRRLEAQAERLIAHGHPREMQAYRGARR